MSVTVTLFHAPRSRSTGTLLLLEELGAPYRLELINFGTGQHLEPAFRAVNPMGKVPAVLDGDTLVTEQVALTIHLADRFPEAGLAPPIGSPARGTFLRWIAFYGSCFEPAIVDRALKREPGPRAVVPYGDFDTVWGTIEAELVRSPCFGGETYTAADVLWGTALDWMVKFGLTPHSAAVEAYLGRRAERPAVTRVDALDAQLVASLG